MTPDSAATASQVTEGKARFWVQSAFYRPTSTLARDLAVLAATEYRQRQGQLRVLDAMTGCGVRPLRYLLEAKADWVWANEGNPDLAATLTANLAQLPSHCYRLTHQDAKQVFLTCYLQGDFYDLVDIDNFGSPAPYASLGLGAARIGGLIYLTSTDGRATGGHDLEASLRRYGACARSHPAVHEQGLRLLIGHVAQAAAAKGLGIEPVFSLFTGQVHRAMVRLVARPTLSLQTYGFLAYCHGCGHFQTVPWHQIGRVTCPCQARQPLAEPPPLVLSGPMWLASLHDPQTLVALQQLAKAWGWADQAQILGTMARETAFPPYYYPLGEIGRRGQMDIPNRDRLIAALQAQGYGATVPHWDRQAVKTDASFQVCLRIAQGLQQRPPE